jgi:mRNA-degrading endonuclease RelE of RelBE toxin-antitoxin system
LGRFEVRLSREAVRQYNKLPKDYKRLVDIALFRLSEGLELNLRPVKGKKDVYRIRVGKYRILFVKFNESLLVFKISPKGDVYKR